MKQMALYGYIGRHASDFQGVRCIIHKWQEARIKHNVGYAFTLVCAIENFEWCSRDQMYTEKKTFRKPSLYKL